MDTSPERQMGIVYRKLHYIVINDNKACLNGLNLGYIFNLLIMYFCSK